MNNCRNNNQIKWKGHTYNEIISIIKRNKNKNISTQNIFLANPSKIYRRELPIASIIENINSGENERTSLKINEKPGGSTKSLINNTGTYCNSPLYNNLIIQKEYDAFSINHSILHDDLIHTNIINTIKKIRSSGMNTEKPTFISNSKIGTKYYTDKSQHINSINHKHNIYNPNNEQFSQQGGVSYSNYILRKKFDINRINNEITCATYNLPLCYAETIKNTIGDTGSLCVKII
jgi:hypothetical protein